jgi:hypothetical protein
MSSASASCLLSHQNARRPGPQNEPLCTTRRTRVRALAFLVILGLSLLSPAMADVRIKDITDVEGVRENQLIGYGLVVGLNGTGDKLNNNVFTRESLIGCLSGWV